MRFVVVLALVCLFMACGSSTFDLDAWRDADGNELPHSSVYSHAGFEHCGTEDVWVLGIGRDRTAGREAGGDLFLRDPDDVLSRHLGPGYRHGGEFDPSGRLPPEAIDTGFRSGDVQLWLEPDRSAAYLVFEDHTERWPRTTYDHDCD